MFLAVLLFSFFAPNDALAWWSKDWPFRQQITIDTTHNAGPQGALREAPIIVRLHSGNFAFSTLRGDGGDLRFVAADDQTPLPFSIQQFDKTNELAIVRVMLPVVEPNRRSKFWVYYGNPKAQPASEPAATRDKQTVLAYDFERLAGPPRDLTAYGNNASDSSASVTPAGAIGEAAAFSGASRIYAPASPSLQFTGAAGVTAMGWIRQQSARDGLIFAIGEKNSHSLSLAVEKGRLVASIRDALGAITATAVTGEMKLDVWRHVAVALGPSALTIYVDGEQQASVPAQAALPLSGAFRLGTWEIYEPGFVGLMDEVEVARVVRASDFIRVVGFGNGPDSRLVTVGAAEERSRLSAYLGLLATIARQITTDGWVVIGLIGLLGFISGEVAISKSLALRRMDRANVDFLAKGDDVAVTGDMTDTAGDPGPSSRSPLFRVHAAALAALSRNRTAQTAAGMESWSTALSDIVRSAIGRALVAEAAQLNKNMVLLTLSISGAPFLGLLGTVMGVMITFASIAQAGDVDVNTIAPGISAALAATVSGLVVAIPVLFYYNILTAGIRERMNALEVYAEELQSRIAFAASARK